MWIVPPDRTAVTNPQTFRTVHSYEYGRASLSSITRAVFCCQKIGALPDGVYMAKSAPSLPTMIVDANMPTDTFLPFGAKKY
jgi:hypothetical protein